MSNKLPFYLMTFGAIIFIVFLTINNKINTATTFSFSVAGFQHDTVIPRKSFKHENLRTYKYLSERLKPIKENFKRINSITEWTAIKTKDISNSGEGGEMKFYYLNGQLEKIISRNFGETFQQINEYYLVKKQLSFAFEKNYKYNRPIYYDSATMKAENDTEAFNFEKSDIAECRSYLVNGELIHQLKNKDYKLSSAKDYLLTEQKRIKEDFEKLIKLNLTK
ncbi:MAG: hypothetical protein ABI266_05840 [Ginsengibacter sp.]